MKPSQRQARAGASAGLATKLAVFWSLLAVSSFFLRLDLSFSEKTTVIVIGLFFIFWAVLAWIQRLGGGEIQMVLSQDPVIHGTPVTVEFQVFQSINAPTWTIQAEILSDSTDSRSSGFQRIWTQDYTADSTDKHRIRAEVTFPSEFPSTAASDKNGQYRATLTLRANGMQWEFDLSTRGAARKIAASS